MMRHARHKERGLAAVELALMLPALMLMLLLMVEGANAFRVFSAIHEASREGARLVLRDGDVASVPMLVESLIEGLPETVLTTNVMMDGGGTAVTVEIAYEYQSFYGYNPALDALGDGPFTFHAATTMPLP
ncbi:MAG: pilus assembly protein [Proteobacteria bacterium]|nr:pilus assembly protein [Pseudomonadota bacterium]MBU1612282.1 pilus assembly protein [Pseudomonadota bacterium]